jgi:hypothetical protein
MRRDGEGILEGTNTIGDAHADAHAIFPTPAPSNSTTQEMRERSEDCEMVDCMLHPRPKPPPRGEQYQ